MNDKKEQIRIVKRYYVEKITAKKLARSENVLIRDLGCWVHMHLAEVRSIVKSEKKE